MNVALYILMLLATLLLFYIFELAKRRNEIMMMINAESIANKPGFGIFTLDEKDTLAQACKISAYRHEGVPNNFAQGLAQTFRVIAKKLDDKKDIENQEINLIKNYIVFAHYRFPFSFLNKD